LSRHSTCSFLPPTPFSLFLFLFLIPRLPPRSTLFPYTTLFRSILNPLFQQFPDHPGLAHYIIHANDSPRLASLGLDAARRYANIDRKSTRLNSSHEWISYAVFCLKKKKIKKTNNQK